MRPLSTLELLELWEAGRAQTPAVRALSLIARASPGAALDDVARLPIGERDGLLFTLREWHFGSRVDSRATCRSCDEVLELDFETGDVLVTGRTDMREFRLESGGYEVEFRQPSTVDLLAGFDGDASTWPRQLLERCVAGLRRDGAVLEPGELPADLAEAVVAELADADPRADIRLAVSCESCGTAHELTFDIVTFVWAEIDAWAQRTLLDVHQLASAYGWSENDVLALGPVRREYYLAASSR